METIYECYVCKKKFRIDLVLCTSCGGGGFSTIRKLGKLDSSYDRMVKIVLTKGDNAKRR